MGKTRMEKIEEEVNLEIKIDQVLKRNQLVKVLVRT